MGIYTFTSLQKVYTFATYAHMLAKTKPTFYLVFVPAGFFLAPKVKSAYVLLLFFALVFLCV